MNARMHRPRPTWPRIFLFGLLLLPGSLAAQQTEWDARRVQMSRAALESLLASYEEVDRSSAYSDELRARARSERDLVRSRLENGDFRVGDQIALVVLGEEALSRTYTVEDGPLLRLPEMGGVDLRGVLRSELEDVVTRHLSRYFHQANVRATSTILITVTGSVANPGFHMVEARRLITDVLAEAGGLSGNANLEGIRIERGDQRIWSGEALQDAIIEGRTLDELSLRAGDQVIIPSTQERSSLATWALRIATPGFLLLLIQQAF